MNSDYTHIIYCDGSCSPTNPGNMGVGVVIESVGEKTPKEVISISMNVGYGTNNRAELLAAIIGIRSIIPARGQKIKVVTDSAYVVRGMNEWSKKWIAHRRLHGKDAVKNVTLWRALLTLCRDGGVYWEWCKGHADSPQNIKADELALKASISGPNLGGNILADLQDLIAQPIYPNDKFGKKEVVEIIKELEG